VAGVPIALFGLGYYAAMGYLAWRRIGAEGRGGSGVLALGGLVGLATSVFLAYQSSLLGVWCLFCVSTYGANLLLAIGSALETRSGAAFSGAELVNDGGAAVAMGLVSFIVGVVVYQAETKSPLAGGGAAGGGADGLVGLYEKIPGRIMLDGTEPARGAANGKYTLVEWADYECPHCAKMAPELEKVVADNPDVKVLFKHYPISGLCNQFVQGERHLNACNAAASAECARQQGRFYELSDAMFANQQYLAPDDIKFIAREKGLDLAALEACLAKPETIEAVKADVAAGGEAQIEGTPSIFLYGLFGDEWVRVNGGRDEINAILKAARAGQPLPPPAPPQPH
jgi:protein-disulfide isomerase